MTVLQRSGQSGEQGAGDQALRMDPASRAAAIKAFDLAPMAADPHLDALCRVVAQQCAAPIALVSLVEEQEQRFLGRAGTDLGGTPRSTALCATTMTHREPLIVPDARADPRFADFALVTGEPYIRFYAGVPLITEDGVPLGALCVLDSEPRDGLTDAQHDALLLMAAAVMDHLTLRRLRRDGRIAAHRAAAALDESELRFRTLADAMPQMVWSSGPDGYSDYFNARWYEFTGQPEGACDGNEWSLSLHPDDLQRTLEIWSHCVATGDPYDLEYRLRRADGDYRWTLTRGLAMRKADGGIQRWFGTCTDIHDQRLALEEREIISQELSHRIKNIFAVISGLIGLSARDRPEYQDISKSLRERIMALGRAHDFVRPHSLESRPQPRQIDSLQGLLRQIFAPYEAAAGERVTLGGDDLPIDDRSATPLALLFHEVVTNAAKYGALSVPDGTIELHIARENDQSLMMRWTERGGPEVAGVMKEGFGTRLLDLSVRRQLGGDFVQDWQREGLEMTVRVPLTAFSRKR